MRNNSHLKSLILILSTYLLVSASVLAKSPNQPQPTAIECKQEVGDNNSGNVSQTCFGNIVNITNVTYKSNGYKELQQEINDLNKQLEQAQKRAQKYPDDVSFQNDQTKITKKLREKLKQLTSFKNEITKLYNDLQNISSDSKRLNKAKALFEEGKFREARAFLEAEEPSMRDEQTVLLKQQDVTQKKLRNNAEEYITLAKFTAIDYSLKEQRIPKASKFFESALKSDRSLKNLFEYAIFSQKKTISLKTQKNIIKKYLK